MTPSELANLIIDLQEADPALDIDTEDQKYGVTIQHNKLMVVIPKKGNLSAGEQERLKDILSSITRTALKRIDERNWTRGLEQNPHTRIFRVAIHHSPIITAAGITRSTARCAHKNETLATLWAYLYACQNHTETPEAPEEDPSGSDLGVLMVMRTCPQVKPERTVTFPEQVCSPTVHSAEAHVQASRLSVQHPNTDILILQVVGVARTQNGITGFQEPGHE